MTNSVLSKPSIAEIAAAGDHEWRLNRSDKANVKAWNKLAKDVRFDYFNLKTVTERLKKLQDDAWKAFVATPQTVPSAMFKQVGAKR